MQFIPPTTPEAAPAEAYRIRYAHFARLRAEYQQRSDRQGIVNVVLFTLAVVWAVVGLWRGMPIFYLVALAFLIGFMASYSYHARLDDQRRRYAELARMQEEGEFRLARDWAQLPLPNYPPATPDHPTAVDLDLVGRASLLHLLGTPRTPAGLATLQAWVLQSAPPKVATARHGAVAELAPAVDYRDALGLAGRLMGHAQRTYEGLLAWAEGDQYLVARPWLVWLARILPAVNAILIVLQLTGVTRYPLWLIGAAVGYGVTLRTGKAIQERIGAVAETQNVFKAYAELFDLVAGQDFADPDLRRAQDAVRGQPSAGGQMRRLAAIMPLIQFQGIFFFIIIQSLTLWNVHVLGLLEWWQATAGRKARGWLDAVGEVEALVALGTLAFDQPEWAFPRFVAEPVELVARELGHPLLAGTTRVGNGVSIGPPGTFLLVTGSNMSGKSTLLRAIGVNVVLAQAGGPVCAAAMALPPVRLATSIRIQDSLEQGVSYYMAELRRLKQVVDSAEGISATFPSPSADGEGGGVGQPTTCLFLLDEILHGTNTAERQIAARHIIAHLLRLGAMGAVSTHDLTLAQSPELEPVSQRAHFTEDFARVNGTPVMRFDYQLRPGLATSTNALKLMEIVGLPGLAADVAEGGGAPTGQIE